MTKYFLLLLVTVFGFAACKSQETNDEIRTIKTETNSVRLKLSDYFDNYIKLGFTEDKIDTLAMDFIEDELSFKMYTGIDSIELNIPTGSTMRFKVEMPEMQPIIVVINNAEYQALKHDAKSVNDSIKYWYSDIGDPSLKELKAKYPIDSLIANETTDLGKIKKISSWVHNLWVHDGDNVPEKNDAIFILDEVIKQGKQFRCVEYGIVTAACLNSVGIKARKFSLATKNIETSPYGAGHVLLEAYMPDLNKWIMIDSQFDVIPHIGESPLNAIELRKAIADKSKVEVWTNDTITADNYTQWIAPYLYYMSVKFDNRENGKNTYNGKTQLMLVPLKAKEPKVFQRRFPIENSYYTNNLLDFYRNPE